MRKNTKYSAAIKAIVLAKLFSPNAPSIVDLAKEFNIPEGTIHTWKFRMSNDPTARLMSTPQRPKDKSPEAKLTAVMETIGKTEQEQGAYCRANGIYFNHLNDWKKQMLEGLGAVSTNAKELKATNQSITNENKQLKQDLHRKDRALAEVSALLILKKKAELIWGVNEDA
jgi:transposase-like protein